ncbi:hypothetical protein MUO93_07975 [Candidatus Bathyarchaeota archaeon]|jgi:phage host-nuclease inhibitor protein Gam|nr:hypothetical protein [Candidatus Bathyarchaeota archaeon]
MSSRAENKPEAESSMSDVVRRIEDLEREVNRLKVLIPGSEASAKPAPVSLRGAAKLLVSMDELERGIEEAKSTIFRYELR